MPCASMDEITNSWRDRNLLTAHGGQGNRAPHRPTASPRLAHFWSLRHSYGIFKPAISLHMFDELPYCVVHIT
jgi:hypothetical protein